MRENEKFLERIFQLARRAPEREASEPPFGMETAVLAHWRAIRHAPRRAENGGLLPRLRWAALIACVLALSSGVLAREELAEISHLSTPEARITDFAMLAGYGND